jgi:hypothetical protein
MTKKMTLARAKKILRVVPSPKSFWLCTNEYLRSLNTLALSLEDVSDDVFRYHVDKYKNDFSNWVKDVIDDKDLAREISRIKTRATLIRKIRENVDESKNLVKRYQAPARAKKSVRKAKKPVAKKSAAKKRGVKKAAAKRFPAKHAHNPSRRRKITVKRKNPARKPARKKR